MNTQLQNLINETSMTVYVICFFAGLSAFLLILFIQQLNSTIEDEERTYMDPLPPGLKLVWPLIKIISYFLYSFAFLEQTMKRINKQLQYTGVNYLLSPEQFAAIKILSTVFAFIVSIIAVSALKLDGTLWIFFITLVGFALPSIWLNDNRKRRVNLVIRAMPIYLDFITMCVQAGLNLQGAIGQAVEKAPTSPLKNQFNTVLRDIRAGVTRSDALRRMADRLQIKEVTSFVSAIIQAEKMGAAMSEVLEVQSEQRRSERFQRAEKMAMEAPIKLVGPLIIFIFPVTFIVLGFPIVMKFLSEGIM
jgi:tight adherence protein C